ncbi:MAG: 2-methylaconitate cis-trans isomerase PrpF [Reinekea sp.]
MTTPQMKIAATYMRGGTSKGVFFNLTDLPKPAQQPGTYRDQLLLRVIGSPDPYGKHTDGMGGATSSTSKAVIVSKSDRLEHDVDYLFGQISIDQPFVDWSGNCGNLTAAVGAFAINQGLVAAERLPENGVATVRIWQANIRKTIIAYITMTDGQVQETGDFMLDGVTFPGAEIPIEFVDPADADGALFPTGHLIDQLEVPSHICSSGSLPATLINSGIPTIFVRASDIGFQGTELQDAINGDTEILNRFEQLRAIGALKMGLIERLEDAAARGHTPKIAFVAPAQGYVSSSGKAVAKQDVDLLVRALSMGKLHHAMMGTAAVAIATAAVIPGTLVNEAAGGGERAQVCFGHPSGTLTVGAKASLKGQQWNVESVTMSRSARVLMEGWIRVPVPN